MLRCLVFFWPIVDLSHPPRYETVLRRRPLLDPYWESGAFDKANALRDFVRRWNEETGGREELPPGRKNPSRPGVLYVTGGGRRVSHFKSKDQEA